MESRLRGLKFDESDKVSQTPFLCSDIISNSINFIHGIVLYLSQQSTDEKEKESSPFDTNGLKKDEPVSNGGINGIDDDKGFK